MSEEVWHLLHGENTSPWSVSMSSLFSVIAACPNCRLETFEISYETERKAEDEVAHRPFAIKGQLCAAHWPTHNVTAS